MMSGLKGHEPDRGGESTTSMEPDKLKNARDAQREPIRTLNPSSAPTPVANVADVNNVTGDQAAIAAIQPPSAEKMPTSAAPQWKYLPPPVNEPDPHTEFDQRRAKSPEGFTIFGARVRGKETQARGHALR